MKMLHTLISIAGLALTTAAVGDDTPRFCRDAYPVHALESRMRAEQVLTGEQAKLDAEARELIALTVAAQIP